MSRIRANTITNQNANGAPDFPNGITVTGIVTSTVLDASVTNLTVTGNLGVGGTITYEDVTNVDSVGVITARDGLRVTGIATATEYEVVNTGNTPIFRFRGSSNNEIGKIDADAISGTTSQLRLYTENSGRIGERLRIGPAGQIGLGGANYGTSGQVLTSQGSGSAVAWTTLSSGLYSGVALLQDQKSSGTHGGQPPNTSQYNERDLNTEVFDTGNFVSLSSNNFILTSGTYLIRASIPAMRTNQTKALLYNVSDSSTVAYSQNLYARDSAVTGANIDLTCRFTIGGTKTFDIRQRVSNSDGEGFGHATGYGDTEIYTQVLIYKEN